MKRMLMTVFGALAALAFGLTLAGPATAGPPVAPASFTPQASFTAQARAAGYTAGQADRLQAQVDHYRTLVGGTQVGINKIEFPGGEVLLPLPGEAKARELGASTAATVCSFQHFCIFHGTWFRGPMVSLYYCNRPLNLGWFGMGSYRNFQTTGTRATFYDTNGLAHRSYAAPYSLEAYDWTPIVEIDPC